MARFTWFPDASVSTDVEPAVASAKFGDGYEQRTPMGINSMPQRWSLTFTGSRAETDAIIAFLREHKGAAAFDWKTPDEEEGRYICRKWSKVRERGAKSSVSCEFEQVFGA